MSTTRAFRVSLGIIAAVAVVFAAAVLFVQAKYGGDRVVDGGRLARALAEYAGDYRSRGEPLPASVTLDALIRSGHLRPEDAKAFEGVKVIFHTDADERYPGSLLAEAHMPDGSVLAALADGSVQGFSRQRFEEFRKNAGQGSGPANGRQPTRWETNQTPAAATCAGAELPRRALRFSGSTAAEARSWEEGARQQLAGAIFGRQMPVRVALDSKETNVEHRATYDILRVTYRSTETRTNYALVAVPKGAGRKPAIVALHGHESAWGQADLSAFGKGNIDDFCDYFAERGFVVVFPAVLDHSAKAGDRPLVGIWVWDALRCVDYLVARADVDAGRIGCVGLSTGGMLALYLAALDERVGATVSAGYFTTWNYLETGLKAPPHCLDGQLQIRGLRSNLDICDIAGLIAPRALMLMHGRKDVTFCPGADAGAINPKWQRRVMDVKEFGAALGETWRVYSAFNREEQLRMYFHPEGHKVDNGAAYGWIDGHFGFKHEEEPKNGS